MHPTMIIDENQVKETMKYANISRTSIAFDAGNGKIYTKKLTFTNNNSKTNVEAEKTFGVASLSKPVFAYLVLKLIEDNKPGKEPKYFKFKKPFDLETPLHTILSNNRLCECNCIEKINVKTVLSHQTGLPHDDEDWDKLEKKPFKFAFAPGSGKYLYSNVAISYLQDVIENLTGFPLQVLAKRVVFDELGMKNSAFIPHNNFAADKQNNLSKPYAACDLHTTPKDYAKFIRGWWQDKTINYAFNPIVSMTNDDWAIGLKVPLENLKHVAWGLGIALQIDDNRKAVKAFHTGDMDTWRAMVAMDLETEKIVVLCCNGCNGHLLIEPIVSPMNVELTHALDFFFKKFGFARKIENGYSLGLMTEAARIPGRIYLKDKIEGLQYEWINQEGKLEKNMLPWHKLPADLARNSSDIIEVNDKFLPTLLLEEARFRKIENYLMSRNDLNKQNSPISKEKNVITKAARNSQLIFSPPHEPFSKSGQQNKNTNVRRKLGS